MITLTVDGLELSLSNWSERTGRPRQRIRYGMLAGWTPRQCVGFDDPPRQDRKEIKIPAKGNLLTIRDWSAITGISRSTIYNRYVTDKWSAEEALGFKKRPIQKPKHRGKNRLIEFQPVSIPMKTIQVIDSKELGRQLKEVRRAAGLSRERAAQALGITKSRLLRIELGNRKCDAKLLKRFNEVAKGWVKA